MDVIAIMGIAREAVLTALSCAFPLMAAALVTGLTVSILQAATQINEATLSFVPKLLVMFLMLLVSGSWMLEQLVNFTVRLFERIPFLVGGG